MEFGLLMTDIPVYVSCKFEMYIFKITLGISENVRIASLYELSKYIYTHIHTHRVYLKTKETKYP